MVASRAVRVPAGRFPEDRFPERSDENPDAIVLRRTGTNGDGKVIVETTLGRLLFNEAFPPDFPFENRVVRKRDVTEVVGRLVEQYARAQVAESLDALKDLGFHYATRAGLTISIADVKTPRKKAELLDHFEQLAATVETQYERGVITDDERRQKEIEIWTDATDRVRDAMQEEMRAEKFNPIDMMVGSGARGNVMQVRQIAGMRGLVANPRGEIIPRPIKSNFREGLSVLEYFISTHGARKGLADTALRTADSGYLTRRLVDVAQELIVREDDCGTTRGIWVEFPFGVDPEASEVENAERTIRDANLETKLFGRCIAEDLTLPDGTVFERNTEELAGRGAGISTHPQLHDVTKRLVDTDAILKHRYSLRRAQHRRRGEAAEIDICLGWIALARNDCHTGRVLLQVFPDVRLPLHENVLAGINLHIGGDVLERNP